MSVPISVSHLQMSQVTPLWCSVTVHLSPLAMLGAMTASESHWGLVGSLGKQAFRGQKVKCASVYCKRRFGSSAAWLRNHHLIPQRLSSLYRGTCTFLCLLGCRCEGPLHVWAKLQPFGELASGAIFSHRVLNMCEGQLRKQRLAKCLGNQMCAEHCSPEVSLMVAAAALAKPWSELRADCRGMDAQRF